MLYLDNCATTPIHPQVLKVMTDVLEKHFGNPSSLHKIGLEAERLLRRSRQIAASTLGVGENEIIFTSGGTEGDNLAIKGTAFAYQNRGQHIITTKIEHPAVIAACRQLENMGFSVTYLEVNNWGLININELVNSIRNDTILVSVMHVNNEVGSIQPLDKIGRILRNYPKIIFHADGVQGFAKVPLKLKDWGVDIYTISGHKINGPKGVGAVYVRDGVKPIPLLAGGGQEGGLRSGTENLPGIVGFAKSCQIAREIFVENGGKIIQLRKKCINLLRQNIQEIIINSPEDKGSPYILNVSIPGLKGEVLVHALEEQGVFVSTGSACSSKKDFTSPVLNAMGIDRNISSGSIRVSFSYDTEENHIDYFVKSLGKVYSELKNVG
ncbi:MAG: cysteine desulfurase family protein [Bacillota bacterium]